jgi:transcriptional regulator with XRE-family HTH domain
MSSNRSPLGKRFGLSWQSIQPSGRPAGNGPASTRNIDVGGRLRQLREKRDLSLRALSEKSGLAINTLSLIENGKSSPTVSTLLQIAVALEIPVTSFFETETPKSNIAYVRHDRRPQAAFEHGILEDLGSGSSIQVVEPLVVTLELNASSGSQDIGHTGYEFVFCLEGQIAYTIEGHTYLLETGDSLLFEAHLPHRWKNKSSVKSRFILIFYPTVNPDYLTERHFLGSTP